LRARATEERSLGSRKGKVGCRVGKKLREELGKIQLVKQNKC